LRIDSEREVHPKGFEGPMRIHRVAGIAGRYDLSVPEDSVHFVELTEEIRVRIARLEGTNVSSREVDGRIWAGSDSGAKIRSGESIEELRNVRIRLVDADGSVSGACYAKVVEGSQAPSGSFTVRFTTRSGPIDARMQDALPDTRQAP
jgi:hypothetical protein